MMKKDNLDRVYLKKPCSTEWNLMEGNDQIRFCSECNKQVYNLSSMTRKQAEDLLAKGGGELCAKIDRDDRGKIITAYRKRSIFFQNAAAKFHQCRCSHAFGNWDDCSGGSSLTLIRDSFCFLGSISQREH